MSVWDEIIYSNACILMIASMFLERYLGYMDSTNLSNFDLVFHVIGFAIL